MKQNIFFRDIDQSIQHIIKKENSFLEIKLRMRILFNLNVSDFNYRISYLTKSHFFSILITIT
jgi:hypothetical protein